MSKVIWLNRGPMTVYFGFCPSEAAWHAEFKRLKVPAEPYPQSDARCTHLIADSGKRLTIVTVSERLDPKRRSDPIGLWALIGHEAMHVWQRMRDVIGEDKPSWELEAYTWQHIFAQLADAYEQTRGPNAKRVLRKRGGRQRLSRGARKQRVGGGRKQSRQRARGSAAKGKRVARRKVQKRV